MGSEIFNEAFSFSFGSYITYAIESVAHYKSVTVTRLLVIKIMNGIVFQEWDKITRFAGLSNRL
jgi:hypothetical protein